MKFAFDEPKRQANIVKHGFDLAAFEEAFSFDRFLNIAARPSRTGRARFKLIGTWYGETVVVAIVSPLGSEAIDVVSVRRAGRSERPMTKRNPAPGYVPTEAYSQADWDAVSDNPPLTEAELARARPGVEGMPPAMAKAFAKRGGRPKAEHPSVPVSLRVPAEVLAAYKAGGPGWQTRMNDALAAGLASSAERASRPKRSRAGRNGTETPPVERREIKRTA